MSPYSLPALLAFAVNVSLVIIILLDNLKSRTHRLFALLVLCFVVWNAADILIINTSTLETARIGGNIIVAALLAASVIFLLLSFSFPRPFQSHLNRWPIKGALLVPPLGFMLLAGLQSFSALALSESAELHVFSYSANEWESPLVGAMFTTVFVYLAWGAINYAVQFRHAESRLERLQTLYILLGMIAFALLIIGLDALHRDQRLRFYASCVLTLLISTFFAYAVLGNKLVALRRIGKQSLAYFLLTGLVFGFYLIVIKHISEVLGRQFNISSQIFDALAILFLAIVFRPLVVRVQFLIDNLFYQNIFHYRRDYIQFSRDSFHLTTVRDLVSAVVRFLKESLLSNGAEVMLKEEESGVFRNPLDSRRATSLNNDLTDFIGKEQRTYEIVELLAACPEDARGFLRQYSGGYVVPLLAEKGLSGFLLIGPSASKRPYTLDETDFLVSFAHGVSLAIERNMLVEKMRAEEIRTTKMEKLAALGRLTAVIAHEFRNPLNIISTAAQTILRNPDDAPLHRETGRYILEEADRLNRTVDEFLQFAKPHTPLWERGMIDDVLETVFQALRTKAKERTVTLVKRVDPLVPELTTSHQHIERTLINLGLNAIEAMPHGGELSVDVVPKGDHSILISVKDTGPGIPTEYHSRLFDPFFTTKPTGTGLGLAIVYMLVQSVKGTISFVSDTSGTTFTIDLPIDGSKT